MCDWGLECLRPGEKEREKKEERKEKKRKSVITFEEFLHIALQRELEKKGLLSLLGLVC